MKMKYSRGKSDHFGSFRNFAEKSTRGRAKAGSARAAGPSQKRLDLKTRIVSVVSATSSFM